MSSTSESNEIKISYSDQGIHINCQGTEKTYNDITNIAGGPYNTIKIQKELRYLDSKKDLLGEKGMDDKIAEAYGFKKNEIPPNYNKLSQIKNAYSKYIAENGMLNTKSWAKTKARVSLDIKLGENETNSFVFRESGMNINDDVIGGCTDMACFSNTILDPFVRSFTKDAKHFPDTNINLTFDGTFLKDLLKFDSCNTVQSKLIQSDLSSKGVKRSEIINDSDSDSEGKKPQPKKPRKGGKRDDSGVSYYYNYDISYDYEGQEPIRGNIQYPKTDEETILNKYVIGNENKNAFLQSITSKSISNNNTKNIIIQVKEMGDVLQVFTMLAWHVCRSNSTNINEDKKKFVMTTIDSIVFLLCIMFQLPCIVYEFKNEDSDEEQVKSAKKQKEEKGRTRYLQRYTPTVFTNKDKIHQSINEIIIFNKNILKTITKIKTNGNNVLISKTEPRKLREDFLEQIEKLIEFLNDSATFLIKDDTNTIENEKTNVHEEVNFQEEPTTIEEVNVEEPIIEEVNLDTIVDEVNREKIKEEEVNLDTIVDEVNREKGKEEINKNMPVEVSLMDKYRSIINKLYNNDQTDFEAMRENLNKYLNDTKEKINQYVNNQDKDNLQSFLQELKLNLTIYEIFYEKHGNIYASSVITFLTQNRQNVTTHPENVLFFPCNNNRKQQGKIPFTIWCQRNSVTGSKRGGNMIGGDGDSENKLIMNTGIIDITIDKEIDEEDINVIEMTQVNMYSYLLLDIYSTLQEKLEKRNISDYCLYDFYTLLAFHFNLCDEVFYPKKISKDIVKLEGMRESYSDYLNMQDEDINLENIIDYILNEYNDTENDTNEEEKQLLTNSLFDENTTMNICINNVFHDLGGEGEIELSDIINDSITDASEDTGLAQGSKFSPSTPDQPITEKLDSTISPSQDKSTSKSASSDDKKSKSLDSEGDITIEVAGPTQQESYEVPSIEKIISDDSPEPETLSREETQRQGFIRSEDRAKTQDIYGPDTTGGQNKSKKRTKSRKNKRTRRAKNKRTTKKNKKQTKKRVKTAKHHKSRKH